MLALPAAIAGCGSGASALAGAAAGGPTPLASAEPASGAAVEASASGASTAPSQTGRVLRAGPSHYLRVLRTLRPGDTLLLAPGTYDDPWSVPGLPVFNLNGTAEARITITGPESGPRPLFLGRSTHNTVRLANASFVTIRNLDVNGRNLGGAGVATQGPTRDITIEHVTITGVGGNQQVVGISTVSHPTFNWTIRRNTIVGAGTGIYLGNSDGSNPFVAGLIEHNLIRDTIGYNLQIKHQNPRPAVPGMPAGPSVTTIRHNVFSKGANSSTGGLARPNVLVGHLPRSGPGVDDRYEIHGNLFWQNPTEALFQGEGNVAFHSNVLVSDTGDAIVVRPHNDVPRAIAIFCNTVIAHGTGISVTGGDPTFVQRVVANAVFAGVPIAGGAQLGNATASRAAAVEALLAPAAPLGTFDAYPRAGALRGAPIDPAPFAAFADADLDFDRRPRDRAVRGAYGSDAAAAVWRLRLAIRD